MGPEGELELLLDIVPFAPLRGDVFSDSSWFADGGFVPGLRPRDHRAVLGDVLGADPLVEDLDEQQAERLLNEFMSRQQEGPPNDEDPLEPDEGSYGDCVLAARGREPEERGPGDVERPEPPPLTPEARHNLERLGDARRDVEAFETRNRYQAELRTVLIVIGHHMFRLPPSGGTYREPCKSGEEAEFDRWWAVLEIYRRILATPEMAGRGARSVLPRVLALEFDQLTEQRLEHALGRRKPKTPRKRKKKRRRRGKKKRRLRRLQVVTERNRT